MKEISKKIIKNRIMFQFYFNTEMFSLLPNIVILYDKDKKQLSYANDQIHYVPKPGTLIFFNSYMPHQYSVHDGYEDFRFIHFNIQAVRNEIIQGVKDGAY